MTDLMDTYIENRWMVQPNHANNLQTVHGGHLLKWMDEVGAMSGMRFSGNSCVTARINRVDFEQPILVGDIALIEAYVYTVGQTSIRVRLRAYREDPRTGSRERTTESYFVYVAIDENHQPTPVPELTISTEQGTQLREEAVNGENGE
jgi:acyl-CoA hydrolase